MFELMYQQMQIAFAERINKFIYTVRRIPVIGKCIPEELYARVSLKRVLAVLAAIRSVLGDMINKLLYFLAAIWFRSCCCLYFFGRWEKCFHGTKYHVVLDIFLYEFFAGFICKQ